MTLIQQSGLWLYCICLFCHRFGMVTMETDVEELLTLVINTGRDIDEAVAQLQTMSEVPYCQILFVLLIDWLVDF